LTYAQHLTRGLLDLSVDMLYPGVLVFARRQLVPPLPPRTGNLYHHYLLSRPRDVAGSGGGNCYKNPVAAC
jgi:hypothetical protein